MFCRIMLQTCRLFFLLWPARRTAGEAACQDGILLTSKHFSLESSAHMLARALWT